MTTFWEKIQYTYSFLLLQIAMNMPGFYWKNRLYRLRGSRLGSHINLASRVYMDEYYPALITIGNHVDIGYGVSILCHDSIGKNLGIGPISVKPVTIGDYVYIGAGAIILSGVTIGERSIIGAGALVNRDIPPNSVAVGVPARVIKTTEELLMARSGSMGE